MSGVKKTKIKTKTTAQREQEKLGSTLTSPERTGTHDSEKTKSSRRHRASRGTDTVDASTKKLSHKKSSTNKSSTKSNNKSCTNNKSTSNKSSGSNKSAGRNSGEKRKSVESNKEDDGGKKRKKKKSRKLEVNSHGSAGDGKINGDNDNDNDSIQYHNDIGSIDGNDGNGADRKPDHDPYRVNHGGGDSPLYSPTQSSCNGKEEEKDNNNKKANVSAVEEEKKVYDIDMSMPIGELINKNHLASIDMSTDITVYREKAEQIPVYLQVYYWNSKSQSIVFQECSDLYEPTNMQCTLCVGHGYEKLKATVELFLEFNGMAFNGDLIMNKLLFVRRKRVDYDHLLAGMHYVQFCCGRHQAHVHNNFLLDLDILVVWGSHSCQD